MDGQYACVVDCQERLGTFFFALPLLTTLKDLLTTEDVLHSVAPNSAFSLYMNINL